VMPPMGLFGGKRVFLGQPELVPQAAEEPADKGEDIAPPVSDDGEAADWRIGAVCEAVWLLSTTWFE
jgi:hypothetical protein